MVTIIKSNSKPKDLKQILLKTDPAKKLDAKKFSGVLKLAEHPLYIQKQMRDEWK